MNLVTLSFDNGPDPDVTPGVLDVLDHHGLPATFFVVGSRLQADPRARAAAVRAHAAGHWIGNHSHTHTRPLGKLTASAARDEIRRCQEALGALAHPRRLFRPFGGGGKLGNHLLNQAAVDTLVKGGYTCVTWNSVPGDWKDPDGWIERAKADCVRLPWALIVLHDIPGACLGHLDGFLSWLKEEGYGIRREFPDDCLPLRKGRIDPTMVSPDAPG